ncbi:MAG: 50S ribosomal protein L4 [Acidobacteriota bacterium]
MLQIPITNLKNQNLREITLPSEVFSYPLKRHLIYEAVCYFRARDRAGSAATKNRSDVAGGGRKPWRQKKTGRARHGSSRSPLWRGGGTIQGPHPRSYDFAFPRRMQRNALRSVLSEKVREGKLRVVEPLAVESRRTRDLLRTLEVMDLAGSKTLLVDDEVDPCLDLATRNLKNVATVRTLALNAYRVLDHETVVLSVPAVKRLEGWLGP